MRIISDDGTIELSRGTFTDPRDFDASVESRGFAGRVNNIFLLSAGEFFSQIRANVQLPSRMRIRSRSGRVYMCFRCSERVHSRRWSSAVSSI